MGENGTEPPRADRRAGCRGVGGRNGGSDGQGPADGRVVALTFGCGAHSEIEADAPSRPTSAAYDETGFDLLELDTDATDDSDDTGDLGENGDLSENGDLGHS